MNTENNKSEALNKTDVSSSVLIAEFMGWVKSPFEHLPNKMYNYDLSTGKSIGNFQYKEDWNELMPVVEKIFTLRFNDENAEYYRFRTFGLRCEETNEFMVRFERHPLFKSNSLLEATFLAVVDCLQSYSQTDC